MPLSLALKEGDEFSVGPHFFSLVKIYSERHARLRIPGGKVVDIDDEHAGELAPRVFVMLGTRGQRGMARIAVEAPREMKIRRYHSGNTPQRPETPRTRMRR